jgi:shikimate kinase
MDCSWKKALSYVIKELKEYLSDGKYANLLKSRKGVGVGFVDGDIKILAK